MASATWTIFDAYGNPVGKSPLTYPLSTEAPIQPGGVPPGDLSPVASFQVIFGGRWNAAYAKFSSGAGVIIYEADQAMTVDWWPACVGYQGGTIENSNIGYSVLEATPSTLFSQAFGVLPDTAQMRVANPNGRKLPTSPGY